MLDSENLEVMANTSRIVFWRPRWRPRDLARTYVVDLDGSPRGRLRPGGELSLNVMPGRHVVQARIDWTGSPKHEISVTRDSIVRVCVEPNGGMLQVWRLFTRTGGLRLTVQQSSADQPSFDETAPRD